MTIAGLITLSGLIATWGLVRKETTCSCVHKSWYFCFLALVSLSIGHATGSSSSLWYAVPATIFLIWFLALFHQRMTCAAYLFGSIFILNMLGNLFSLGDHKLIFTIDVLDILAWIQIGLLWQLARENPLTFQEPEIPKETDHNGTPILRLIYGFGNKSRHKA